MCSETTQSSALSHQPSVLSPQSSVLNPRHSALSTSFEIRYGLDLVAHRVRKAIALLVLLIAFAAKGGVRFVTPQTGAQALGPQWLEIATTAAKVDRVEFYVDGRLVGVARQPPFRVAYDFGTSLDAHTVLAKVHSNGYRNTESATVVTAALAAGDSMTVDFVEIPLRLRATRTVTAANLRVRENGIDQAIRDLKPGRGPGTFVFIIDRSLSMGDGRLPAALKAVDRARTLLRVEDTVSVVLFNQNVAKARSVERGEDLSRVFGDIPPSGGTSLRDAVASIASRNRTYAIVITDGGDRNSRLTDEAALRKISGTRTILHALVLQKSSGFLERAADNTGGRVVKVTASTLQKALRDLIVDINSRYTLAYQSTGSAKGWRRIDVQSKRKGIDVVTARKGYYAE